MTTEKLKRLIKNTLNTERNRRLDITDNQVDFILDLCDDNYVTELNRVIEAQNRVNKIFLIALGKQKFNEIKEQNEH